MKDNVIPFRRQLGLFPIDPYGRALHQQQQERKALEQAKRDTLFPTDLTDREWKWEMERRADFDPDAP